MIVQGPLNLTTFAALLGQPFTIVGDTSGEFEVIGPSDVEIAAAADQARADAANERTIRERAVIAITTNRDFLNLTSPSNAQVLAQVRALTRQNNGLIRLILGQFDDTE